MSQSETDEYSRDDDVKKDAFAILVQVALEAAKEENLLVADDKKLSQNRVYRKFSVKEHGNTWSYKDNVLLWKAYEKWESNDKDIQIWKEQEDLEDLSFPYFAYKNYFSERRTLVGVRKHFFKLKQRNFGTVVQTEKCPTILEKYIFDHNHGEEACQHCRLVVRAPKTMVQSKKLSIEKKIYAADDEKSNDSANAEERSFLRIAQQSNQRRKRKFLEVCENATLKPASSEVLYREIVQKAKMQVLDAH